MTVSGTVDILTNQMWPQGDIRDPLGVWGFRAQLTGDGGGGSIQLTARTAAGESAAYIYTVYSTLIAQIGGTAANIEGKCRILTNWPNIDRIAGVQGYGHAIQRSLQGNTQYNQPEVMPIQPFITALDRFLLMMDPRPSPAPLNLIELETSRNTTGDIFSFEGYGYYWDRSVLNAPGGPRHPGSS